MRSRSPVPAVFLIANIAFAANPSVGGTTLVTPASPQAARFSAVARMGGCTAFAIKPPGADAASPTYAVTAGHCIDLGANDVILDRATTAHSLQFGLLQANQQPSLTVRSRRVVYSTMRRIDIAIVELDTTLSSLESQGIVPLSISQTAAPPDGEADWAGVPTGAVPPDEHFLRTGPCAITGLTDVLEWRWFWKQQIRNDCSDISTGASGSPLLLRGTSNVIGILGTTTTGNPEPSSDGLCARNDPCELSAANNAWRRNTSYATPVAPLAACFNRNGVFQLDAPGCGLDPGRQAAVLESRLTVKPSQTWNATVTSQEMRFFRYKIIQQGSSTCEDATGYSSESTPIPGRITDALPENEARYFLCVVAGVSPTPDETWQQPRFSSIAHLRTDRTPPTEPPRFSLLDTGRGFAFVPAASFSTNIILKEDTAESSTCADLSNYRRIYPVPFSIARGTTKRLCLVLTDAADNPGRPWEIDLIGPSIFPEGVTSAAGYTPRRAAPGSWISIFGVNFDQGGEASAIKAFIHPGRGSDPVELRVTYASASQVNALLPMDTPLGEARIAVQTPDGLRAEADVQIEPAVPGIFTLNRGIAVIYGRNPAGNFDAPLECPPTGAPCQHRPFVGLREFQIWGGGLATTDEIEVTFSEQPVLLLGKVSSPGLERVTVRMPEELKLSGYIPVRIKAGGRESPPAYVWLR